MAISSHSPVTHWDLNVTTTAQETASCYCMWLTLEVMKIQIMIYPEYM